MILDKLLSRRIVSSQDRGRLAKALEQTHRFWVTYMPDLERPQPSVACCISPKRQANIICSSVSG